MNLSTPLRSIVLKLWTTGECIKLHGQNAHGNRRFCQEGKQKALSAALRQITERSNGLLVTEAEEYLPAHAAAI
jgi:hypothetical protein